MFGVLPDNFRSGIEIWKPNYTINLRSSRDLQDFWFRAFWTYVGKRNGKEKILSSVCKLLSKLPKLCKTQFLVYTMKDWSRSIVSASLHDTLASTSLWKGKGGIACWDLHITHSLSGLCSSLWNICAHPIRQACKCHPSLCVVKGRQLGTAGLDDL